MWVVVFTITAHTKITLHKHAGKHTQAHPPSLSHTHTHTHAGTSTQTEQTDLVNFEVWVWGDDGTSTKVDALAHEIAANAALFSFEAL